MIDLDHASSANNERVGYLTMMKLLSYIWMEWIKPTWSKIRWHKYTKIQAPEVSELVSSTEEILSMIKTAYSHYKWTADGVDELFDTYKPAPYLYSEYRRIVENSETSDEVLNDDCDGYHTLIYHILQANGYETTLLTIASSPISKSHTMTVYKDFTDPNQPYYLIDYTRIYKASSVQSLVDNASKRYNYKKVYRWNLQSYNYDKSKFYTVDKDKF